MKDALFIEQMLQKGNEAADKVRKEIHGLSPEQLNWKPAPDSWSIGQCLDHLVITDCLYFPALRQIAEGKYNMSAWQKWNPFSTLFGRMLVQVQGAVKKKLKAPKVFVPSTGQIDTGIFDRFQKHQQTLLEYIAGCKQFDPDRVYITSPISGFITFSLRNAFKILIFHEFKHINQALRIKHHKEFPAGKIPE